MIVRGDWVTPHLNYVKYFEKPPLVYWATALGIRRLRPSELRRAPADAAERAGDAALTTLARAPHVRRARRRCSRCRSSPSRRCSRSSPGDPDARHEPHVLPHRCALFGGVAGMAAARGDPRAGYRVAYAATALGDPGQGSGRGRARRRCDAAVPRCRTAAGARCGPAFDWRGARAGAGDRAAVVRAGQLAQSGVLALLRRRSAHRIATCETKEHGEPIWFFLPLMPAALAPWGLVLLFDPRGCAARSIRARGRRRRASSPSGRRRSWCSSACRSRSWSPTCCPRMPPLAILVARAILWGIERGRTVGLTRVGVAAAGRRSDPGAGRARSCRSSSTTGACRSWCRTSSPARRSSWCVDW